MSESPSTAPLQRFASRVIALRRLSATGYELSLERGDLSFQAGQLINVHGRDMLEDRSYTLCSGERDACLQIVFRLIPSGRLTPWLASLNVGDAVDVSGPYGEFVLRDAERRIYFIATGTGIAPARAYVRSRAGLAMTLLHGVRTEEDLFYREEFAGLAYHACVSGGTSLFFHGRVTDRCATLELPADAHYYLCGANEMFYEMRDILTARGVPGANIFTEAYYYRADD